MSKVRTRSLMHGLKTKLRDPMWQAAGVLLTLISVLTPFIVASFFRSSRVEKPSRLVIKEQTSKFLTDVSEPVGKTLQYLVEGKEERDLRLFVFTIYYTGNEPIRPSDFYQPLRVTIPADRKILGVQKSAKPHPPLRFDPEAGLSTETRTPLEFEVQNLTERTFEIKPHLMNSSEWFEVEIYTSAGPKSHPPPSDVLERYRLLSSEVKWDCRVAGVECPAEFDLKADYGDPLKEDVPSFLQVSIAHEGWSVYLILLFAVIGLLLLVLLGKSAGLNGAAPLVQIILFSLATALSIASAEVAADWLIPDNILGVVWDEGQPIYAYIIFWTQIVIIIILAIVTIWIRARGSRKRRRAPVPKDMD